MLPFLVAFTSRTNISRKPNLDRSAYSDRMMSQTRKAVKVQGDSKAV
ncbi:MAG TPA: hypothetical protein V6C71_02760 [Coleofasciculaceae cyanobacterium]